MYEYVYPSGGPRESLGEISQSEKEEMISVKSVSEDNNERSWLLPDIVAAAKSCERSDEGMCLKDVQ